MSKIKDTIEDEKRFRDKELETIEPKEYRFNEKGHLHELLVDGEWKALTGCTTILGILAKPALIQWAANETEKYIREHISYAIPGEDGGYWAVKPSIFEEAKTAHRRKKEEAGQNGTDVHKEVENLIAGLIRTNKGIFNGDEKSENPQIQHFIDWAVENKVKFLESEKGLYSKKYFLGGIVDIVCELDGEVWIADIKTGSGIYPEHYAQMAGYQIMLEEMGYAKPIKGHIVLNLKKDGKFEEKRSVSVEDAKNFFLACVSCYRLQEKFNNVIAK